jgi:hypothetical protein
MNEGVKKGDKMICIQDFIRDHEILFEKGKTYLSEIDYTITDNYGNAQYGWNTDVFERYFQKIDQ